MVMYEWVPFGATAPRRVPYWKSLLDYLKQQWPIEYRDTSATEGVEGSEDVIKPFTLKDDIGWGVSFKHFEASQKISTISCYVDDKYNDYTERKYPGGESRLKTTLITVDLTYRYTKSVTTLDGDNYPIQFEGNKIMIHNILANCAALQNMGIHYIYEGRTIFDGRFSDEEIFLERLSRDMDPKAPTLNNDFYWIYRKIFKIDVFEGLKVY
ncbi:MAG: hypothetical protein R2685_10880 [Candidatus Nitrosocosmicus sp.]|nr:hypothetical protein [Candidatus Nitrosocosmicus sp.]